MEVKRTGKGPGPVTSDWKLEIVERGGAVSFLIIFFYWLMCRPRNLRQVETPRKIPRIVLDD